MRSGPPCISKWFGSTSTATCCWSTAMSPATRTASCWSVTRPGSRRERSRNGDGEGVGDGLRPRGEGVRPGGIAGGDLQRAGERSRAAPGGAAAAGERPPGHPPDEDPRRGIRWRQEAVETEGDRAGASGQHPGAPMAPRRRGLRSAPAQLRAKDAPQAAAARVARRVIGEIPGRRRPRRGGDRAGRAQDTGGGRALRAAGCRRPRPVRDPGARPDAGEIHPEPGRHQDHPGHQPQPERRADGRYRGLHPLGTDPGRGVAVMREAVQVVQRPLISEKSYAAMATGKYLFRVHPKATKTEIALAIADAFKVEVVSVNTMHVRGKERRRGRTHRLQSNWKKAVVTLAEGQKIESMFQGV